MEKYLFNDGTNVTREVQSKEELDSLIQAAPDRDKVRIWVFNTSEWLSYAAFSKTMPAPTARKNTPVAESINDAIAHPKPSRTLGWIKKAVVVALAAAAILLVYNFTRIKWVKLPELTITAQRPENVPPVNVDSLIQAIEFTRGQKLDKITRTNLRIRTVWPERILLQLTSARDSSSTDTRFHNIELSLDNATGYQLDEAIVELRVWRYNETISKDTLHFRNINYSTPSKRTLINEYKGDSISVSFSSIKAKSFNFCYADDKQSNYGNLNDRWFCK